MSLILFDGRLDALVVAEVVEDLSVGAEAERSDKGGDGQLSVLVYADIKYVVDVGLVLEPRAAVRDNGGRIELLTCFVVIHLVVHARRTDEL